MWTSRIVIAVVLGEAIWGFLVSITINLALPAMARVMGGDAQSPLYLGKGDFNVQALFTSFLELCFAGIMAVLLNSWSQKRRCVRPKPVRTRSLARRTENVEFLLGDPTEMVFRAPFDAVVGRFVLMYYPDPILAIRSLARHLRPGGIMVFQEFDMSYVRSHPAAPTFERASKLMTGTLHTMGTRVQLGADLFSVFVSAGLPGPSPRMDVLIGGGEKFPGYEILADTLQSLLPAMERFGIATAAEVNVLSLAERMREEVMARNGVAFSPALTDPWVI